MAWTTPMTFVSGAALTAAQLNTYLRDNLNETSAAKATTAGGYFVSTATNTIAERVPGYDFVNTSESTTSTSWANLTTPGPDLTITTGTKALILTSCALGNSTVNAETYMGTEITGATSIAPSTSFALINCSSTANSRMQASLVTYLNLTAGSNRFVSKHAVSSGTGTFSVRRLYIFPY